MFVCELTFVLFPVSAWDACVSDRFGTSIAMSEPGAVCVRELTFVLFPVSMICACTALAEPGAVCLSDCSCQACWHSRATSVVERHVRYVEPSSRVHCLRVGTPIALATFINSALRICPKSGMPPSAADIAKGTQLDEVRRDRVSSRLVTGRKEGREKEGKGERERERE